LLGRGMIPSGFGANGGGLAAKKSRENAERGSG
jgi:hypothetical protein